MCFSCQGEQEYRTYVQPPLSHSSPLQFGMDRCFGTDEVTGATNANGKLATLQRAKELLFSGGAFIGLAGLIALFGPLLMSAPASLGVRAVIGIIVLVGFVVLWKSVNWLQDAIGGQRWSKVNLTSISILS